MNKKKNIFISSTGTGVGKTYCTVEIIKELIDRKVNVNVYKPILSGFDFNNIEESDSYKILSAKNIIPKLEDIKKITPWLFEKPIAPSIAAIKENKKLRYNEVLDWCLKKINNNNNEINIFEGAGGLEVPIEATSTVLNLIKDLDCKVILVVGNYLGSVSHSISAIKNIKSENLEIINVIINKNTDDVIDIEDTEMLLKTTLDSEIKFRKVFQNDNNKNISFKKITDDIIGFF
jgi:dethiobiotin synthetase